ncbi:hypothetical protein HY085_00285 [Candidatus Gottesmanbacteria bacterium]|nr:hypothetical protein [Candidatus Gottesmanbacteria bacterium]
MKKGKKVKKESLSRKVEVDVSGQLGLDGDTVFAFSNGENYSILIESVVKRKVKKFYLLSKKSPGRFYFNFYIGGLVILLSRLEKHRGPIYLDWELSGRESEVKGELLVKNQRPIYLPTVFIKRKRERTRK